MVLAQLVERSLAIPEVHLLNPVINKNFIEHVFTVYWITKTIIKKKRPGMAHFLKKRIAYHKDLLLRIKSDKLIAV